jgi:hypothetical protein
VHNLLSLQVIADSTAVSLSPDDVVLITDIRGGESGLCIHVRSQAGGGATLRAISIRPL